jgi:hypothetical protein
MRGDKAREEGGKSAQPPGGGTPAGGPSAADAAAPTAGPVLVETIDQAVAAKGKPARVRGVARREKLGDSIQVEELTVHCHDVRFR